MYKEVLGAEQRESLPRLSINPKKLACAIACSSLALGIGVLGVSGATSAASSDEDQATRAVFFDGRPVELRFKRVRRASMAFRFGPWEMDAHASREKPKDPRPNLYIVAPGDQYSAEAAPLYNHTEIISTMPLKPEAREWDVYWAIVLDPTLTDTFRSERQLILATQDGFSQPPDFELDLIPGATFLRQFLKVQKLEDLDKYRRPDGTLPRLLLAPAGVSIKAAAIDPQSAPEEKESSVSRAFSADEQSRESKKSPERSDPPAPPRR